jgi:hypothetical protein
MPFIDIQVIQKVCGRKRQLADDEREGRPSFRESDAVKNEVRDVINGDRLTIPLFLLNVQL